MKKYRYSIVIPTLNERENMAPLLEAIEQCGLENYEVIVVDEHSPDGTLAAVEHYAEGKPHIRAMLNPGEPGLSPSIVSGFLAADGEILCCMDGDLQHSVGDLKNLLGMADAGCDFVVGSRYASGGGFSERWSSTRLFISNSAAWMARAFLGVTVRDPMSGFFAIRASAFDEVKEYLSPRGFKIMLELLFWVSQSGKYRVIECGIMFGKRLHGESKLSMTVIVQYLQMLFDLRRRRRRMQP